MSVFFGTPDSKRVLKSLQSLFISDAPPRIILSADEKKLLSHAADYIQTKTAGDAPGNAETKFRAIAIVHMYVMHRGSISGKTVNVIAYACIVIASKIEGGRFKIRKDEEKQAEATILEYIDYNPALPTPYQIILTALHSMGKEDDAAVRKECQDAMYVLAHKSPEMCLSCTSVVQADAVLFSVMGKCDAVKSDASLLLPAALVIIENTENHPAKGSVAEIKQKVGLFTFEMKQMDPVETLPHKNRFLVDFELEEGALGEGTFGTVHVGRRKSDGRRFAVKKQKDVSEMGFNESFLVEIATLKTIPKHPNIVELVDVYNDDTIYIVYELLGVRLRDYMKRNGRGMQNVDIMHKIACGVAFLHSYGHVHRDLKPDNVLVGKGRTTKIADFGSADFDPMYPRTMKRAGSMRYRAPEILSNQYADEGVDIWAMACVFYEIAHGKPLFEKPKSAKDQSEEYRLMMKNIKNVLGGTLPGFSETPEKSNLRIRLEGNDFNLLLGRMLDYDKNTRITAYEVLESPVFSAFGNPDATTSREQEAIRHTKRRRMD